MSKDYQTATSGEATDSPDHVNRPVHTAGRLGHARASTTLDVYAHYTALADQTASTTLAGLLVAESGRRLDEANEHLLHVRGFGGDRRGDLHRGTVGSPLSGARHRARVPAEVRAAAMKRRSSWRAPEVE